MSHSNETFTETLAGTRVTVSKKSGEPVLKEIPTVRGHMLVYEVKEIFMIGLGKTHPAHVRIAPVMPGDFATVTAPLGDHELVGAQGEAILFTYKETPRISTGAITKGSLHFT